MEHLYEFWPVPVGVKQFSDSEVTLLNQELRQDIITITQTEEPETRSGIGVWQSGLFKNSYTSFDKLAELIQPVAFKFMVQSGYHQDAMKHYSISSFWINCNDDSQGYHIPHIHGTGDVDWTGIYYPAGGQELDIKSTNYPDAGDLVLHDPNGHMKHMVNPPDRTELYPYYGLPMTIKPQESLMIIFPTWVVHSVAPKGNTPKTRMSIGFNVEKK